MSARPARRATSHRGGLGVSVHFPTYRASRKHTLELLGRCFDASAMLGGFHQQFRCVRFAALDIVVDGSIASATFSQREKESPAEAGLKTWAFAKRGCPFWDVLF